MTVNKHLRFQENRDFDVICLGRLAVDLYAEQIGAKLEDVHSFAKYLGGSSGNIAFGTARLGLKSSMLTRVGDDHMGRFLTQTLENEGCDTSHVRVDPHRLTALVLLGIKDRDTFPLVFYRENCADMAVSEADFSESYIASSRSLLITGTHLSNPDVLRTSQIALKYARKHDVKTVLDIDYRPVLWGLTGQADGETRYIASEAVSAKLQQVLGEFDLIVGTEEEIQIAGGASDIVDALKAIRRVTAATIVLKRGADGCNVFEHEIPDQFPPVYPTFKVEVFNVLGAGDAFMSGLLKGWIDGDNWEQTCRLANACGALVVSRHGCAPAMPTLAELDYFFSRDRSRENLEKDELLHRLHRVSRKRKELKNIFVFAFDHRSQLIELADQVGVDQKKISALKSLFVQAVSESEQKYRHCLGPNDAIGILADERLGQDALNEATGRGWWIGRPVELPGSMPIEFEYGRSVGSNLSHWPNEHIVKCLVYYDVDQPTSMRDEQEAQMLSLYQATQSSGHDLLLEIIPPKDETKSRDEQIIRAIDRLYEIGILPDWWKIEALSSGGWQMLDELVKRTDPFCKGVVLLGLAAPLATIAKSFDVAAKWSLCKGFTVGRSIFHEPSKAWLEESINDDQLKDLVRENFEFLFEAWLAARSGQEGER
nr:5-dehydro-2-deoxygluconokinase [Advenella sp. FME57]